MLFITALTLATTATPLLDDFDPLTASIPELIARSNWSPPDPDADPEADEFPFAYDGTNEAVPDGQGGTQVLSTNVASDANATNPGGSEGAVFYYIGEESTQPTWRKLTPPTGDDAPGLKFGTAVKVTQTHAETESAEVAVSATRPDGSGEVYIYVIKAVEDEELTQKVAPSDQASSDSFGFSYGQSKDGSTLVITAPTKQSSGVTHGGCYVYERGGGGLWEEVQALGGPDADNMGFLGYSCTVSDDGDAICCGSPFASSTSGVFGGGKVQMYIQNAGGSYDATQFMSPDGIDFFAGFGQAMGGLEEMDCGGSAPGYGFFASAPGEDDLYKCDFCDGQFSAIKLQQPKMAQAAISPTFFGNTMAVTERADGGKRVAVSAPFGGSQGGGFIAVYDEFDDEIKILSEVEDLEPNIDELFAQIMTFTESEALDVASPKAPFATSDGPGRLLRFELDGGEQFETLAEGCGTSDCPALGLSCDGSTAPGQSVQFECNNGEPGQFAAMLFGFDSAPFDLGTCETAFSQLVMTPITLVLDEDGATQVPLKVPENIGSGELALNIQYVGLKFDGCINTSPAIKANLGESK